MYDDAWLDDKEYPDEQDIAEFGDDAPPDYDPLTIGYVGDSRPAFWTRRRMMLLVVSLIMIATLLMPFLFRSF